uniref:Uncharacterized protein n=1 Tax=Astyanax mexicanus TaxID=7994 RepID=A0A8B9RNR9_ASTMX
MGCFVGVQFDALGLPGLIPHTSTSPLRVLHCSVCVSSRELYPRLERQADVHGGAVGSSGQNVEGALAQECIPRHRPEKQPKKKETCVKWSEYMLEVFIRAP